MLIGVPKEIKSQEFRNGITPAGVFEIVHHGHQIMVQKNGGSGIGVSDKEFESAGAIIIDTAEEIFSKADMIVKVKEPQPEECRMLRKGQVLFTYLHLAPDPTQTKLLLESGATAIAYETVTNDDHGLPLLTPMSEVAGRLSVQAGAHSLEKINGGSGVLLGGVPGVAPAKVVIIGGGVVGVNAARIAIGMGANVSIIDRSLSRLQELDLIFEDRMDTLFSTKESIRTSIKDADLVIGGVLIPGAAAPKLVTEDMIKKMKKGSVLVDVAIDQGGCFETSRATTHKDPTYIVHDVVHYCVANMPGGVPRTSTFALTNATLPYILKLADKGYREALLGDEHLLNGLNIHNGKVTYEAVARDLGYDYVPAREAL
ncbi:MAG: alanine dehydrogenase [SAR324 cluster bacterium]|nr:alanine dehydrogenase [SAR324 cluster bacterium]